MLQFMSGNVRLLSLFVSEVSHSSSGLDQTDYYVEIERGRSSSWVRGRIEITLASSRRRREEVKEAVSSEGRERRRRLERLEEE